MKILWNDHSMFSFCTNMAMVLEGGLSIEEGLGIVFDSVDKEQADLHIILENYKQCGSLSNSIKDVSFIDQYAKKMIEIGEMSGTLDAVLKELAMYYERNHDLKQNLKEALVYPFLLLVMMWCIVLLIIWKILPIFSSVLQRMGTVLPGNAMTMMQFGNLFGTISFATLSILLIICIVLYLANRKAKSHILACLPFTKRFYYNVTMAKMTYAFSLFIRSGYDVQESLGYLPGVVEQADMEKKLTCCIKRMEQGESFIHAMTNERIYNGIYANMIYTGFRSGKSDEVLQKVSELFEKEVDNSISSFLNIIEPAVVILLSVIVGVILLSVMLPLMSIITSI